LAQAGGGKSELHRARCRVTRVCMERDTRGRKVREGLSTDSATENKPLSGFGQTVRVKRWSKSPPLREKSRRHGKPHREQGQIGDHEAARFNSRFGGMGSGYWPPRQMILAPVRASGPGRQNSAYSSSKVTPGRAAGASERPPIPVQRLRALRLRAASRRKRCGCGSRRGAIRPGAGEGHARGVSERIGRPPDFGQLAPKKAPERRSRPRFTRSGGWLELGCGRVHGRAFLCPA